jgi:diguanylate cyclase (GGDEF)-like protein
MAQHERQLDSRGGVAFLSGLRMAKLIRDSAASPERLSELLVWAVRYATEQERLVRSLRQLALMDDLTGVYGRRGFLAFGGHQMKLARRLNRTVVIGLCDVDGLKHINDSYGHREGDLALQRVGTALKQTFRDSDVIGRLGGDEFAICGLMGADCSTMRLVERLNHSVALASRQEVRYPLTVSVGFACCGLGNSLTIDELLDSADRSLYAQKRRKQAAATA